MKTLKRKPPLLSLHSNIDKNDLQRLGQEEFDRIRWMSYVDAHAVLICYSVDSRDSLENIPNRWLLEVSEYCPEAKILLVALKCDLRDNEEVIKKKHMEPIMYEEVKLTQAP